MEYKEVISKEDFEDIVVFSVSEPGAMGPNDMTFYKKTGESFSVDYKNEKTSYSKIKEFFPVLADCRWNGATKAERYNVQEIVIGNSSKALETQVASGWRHIYLGYGNHIAVKIELYMAVREIFEQYDYCEVTFGWPEILKKTDFKDKIPDLE